VDVEVLPVSVAVVSVLVVVFDVVLVVEVVVEVIVLVVVVVFIVVLVVVRGISTDHRWLTAPCSAQTPPIRPSLFVHPLSITCTWPL